MDQENISMNDLHKKIAIDCFNATWDLIDKKDRTDLDDAMMIHTAHCSRYHWGQIGTPLEFSSGEWQISRVYSLLGMSESAIYHATLCLELCQSNGIGDFDLAFAYEALARAYSINCIDEMVDKYYRLAQKAAEDIEEEGDKKYFLSELATIK